MKRSTFLLSSLLDPLIIDQKGSGDSWECCRISHQRLDLQKGVAGPSTPEDTGLGEASHLPEAVRFLQQLIGGGFLPFGFHSEPRRGSVSSGKVLQARRRV